MGDKRCRVPSHCPDGKYPGISCLLTERCDLFQGHDHHVESFTRVISVFEKVANSLAENLEKYVFVPPKIQ